MTSFLRHNDRVFIGDLTPEDCGEGQRRWVCLVTHLPINAPALALKDVFGSVATLTFVTAPADLAWSDTTDFIKVIDRYPNAGIAFVSFAPFEVSGVVRVNASGAAWLVAADCNVLARFARVGLAIPAGTSVSLSSDQEKISFDAGATDIEWIGSPVFGVGAPATKLAELGVRTAVLECDSSVRVSSYLQGESALGLQYFQAKWKPLSKSYAVEAVQYPLFSTPVAGSKPIDLLLRARFDLAEASAGGAHKYRSHLRLVEASAAGAKLKKLPLNIIAPDGGRLEALAASVSSDLAFHYVSAPSSLDGQGASATYGALALLPHGSLQVASTSTAILGCSLLEQAAPFDRIQFSLDTPAHALDAMLRAPDGVTSRGKTLDTAKNPDAYLSRLGITSAVSYQTLAGRTSEIWFSPDRMALYATSATGSRYNPIRSSVHHGLPVAPIDYDAAAVSTRRQRWLDREVISRHRASLLRDDAFRLAESTLFPPRPLASQESQTPQGFTVRASGTFWSEIEFAKGTANGDIWRLSLRLGADPKIVEQIQRAFVAKEIFIVCRRLPKAATPAADPSFGLKYSAGGWSFESTIVGPSAASPSGGPLVIIKFGSRSVWDLLQDPTAWSAADCFTGTPQEAEAARDRLVTLIHELQADDQAEIAEGSGVERAASTDTFPAPFINVDSERPPGKLFDPNWNGVVVCSLAMPQAAHSFPSDLQPILESYAGRLQATILCADIRPAAGSGSESSQVLALVRYKNDDAPSIQPGNDPDVPGGFDLKLLKVRLRASLVDRFECRLAFRLDKFLGQEFGNPGVMIGTHDRRVQGGMAVDVYRFSLEVTLKKTWPKGSFLKYAELTRVGYERIESPADKPRGRFLLQGKLDFDLEQVGISGLNFDRLGIEFLSGERWFKFSPGLLKINVDGGRMDKLLGKLPFRLSSFVFGRLASDKLLSLPDLGFLPLPFGSQAFGTDFSYAFTFDLDLGSLGALSKKLEGFRGELLLGWKLDETDLKLSFGFKLKGNKGGPLEISLLDVIELRAESYGFGQLKNGDAYYIYAKGLQLKLLGVALPDHDASQSVYVFYPSKSEPVAWLYGSIDAASGAIVPLFVLGQRVNVTALQNIRTTGEGIDELKKVFVKGVEPQALPYDGSTGVVYDPGKDWFVGLEAIVFDLARLQLLVLEPKMYGARVTIPAQRFQLPRDWFFDLLYQRLDEDTGIFSMEVPPPIDVLDFGAVQIVLPTIRGEFGTPGSHLLVDLGYPGKKSIAAWQRTGKIVAGIFGGDGGGYFGRVTPKRFPVQIKAPYDKVYQIKADSAFVVGLAGSFGLMRYFSKGPLSGHASLTGFFLLEGGVAAIEQIAGASPGALPVKPPSTYLMLSGQFGIKGCIEACADFKLIKVYVGLEFKVYYAFDFETWKGIVFLAGVDVSAYARVVIARIKIPFDGKIEIAIEFRFSFHAEFELRLSEDNPDWEKVFVATPSTQALRRLSPPQVIAQDTPFKWTWPAPSPATLGCTSLAMPTWFVAVPSFGDKALRQGVPSASVVGHLVVGEHPSYARQENSILALAEVLLRWMLLQIIGQATWNGALTLSAEDVRDAHRALMPADVDERLHRQPIPGTSGGKWLTSTDANIAAPRPGFAALTAQRLAELYQACLIAQISLPKDGSDPGKNSPACVPFPLPPLFVLSHVQQLSTGGQYSNVSSDPRDLASYQPLTSDQVDDLQRQLDRFHALLIAERDAKGAKAAPSRPMQEWIFLSWHQLFCTELLRRTLDLLTEQGAMSADALLATMVRDPKGIAFQAAQGVSRLFAGGLRFTPPAGGKPVGSFKLAGTLVDTFEPGASERNLLCLTPSPSAHANWFTLDAKHVSLCEAEGLPKTALGYDISELGAAAQMPVPTFVPVRQSGYEDLPREFPLAPGPLLDTGEQIHAFPRELNHRLAAATSLRLAFLSKQRDASGKLMDDDAAAPGAVACGFLKLKGTVVGSSDHRVDVSLAALALEDMEALHLLAATQLAELRVAARAASSDVAAPYRQLGTAALQSLVAFRREATDEEKPTLLRASVQLPYFALGSGELLVVLSAWSKTGSKNARLQMDYPASTIPAPGSEVEILLVAAPMIQGDSVPMAANGALARTGAGTTLFARSDLLQRVASSPAEALLVETVRRPMGTVLVRLPDELAAFNAGRTWVSVSDLHGMRATAFSTREGAGLLRLLEDLSIAANAAASHFDLLALTVKVGGVEMLSADASLPIMPRTREASNLPYLQQEHVYQALLPVKLLTSATSSPYELVGKRVQVFGTLRDHYGQQAPQDPALLLDRVEEYRDELIGLDAWENVTCFLRASTRGLVLVVHADLNACFAQALRKDFARRRILAVRQQVADPALAITFEWLFGEPAVTRLDKAKILALCDAMLSALKNEPKQPALEVITPVTYPTLPSNWSVEPFAAVVRLQRPTSAAALAREATTAVYPERLSVPGAADSVDALKKFFTPVVAKYAARLAVCQPSVRHGAFWLVNPLVISGKADLQSLTFTAIPPFSNRPVSVEEPGVVLLDRDLDAALDAACGAIDALLDEQKVGEITGAVKELLDVKRQLAETCAARLAPIFTKAAEPPFDARRAVLDAVASQARECYRLASIASFQLAPGAHPKSSPIVKLVGDFSVGAPTNGSSATMEISTVGISCEPMYTLPVLVWRAADVSAINVAASTFVVRHVQVNLSAVSSLVRAPQLNVWLRIVDLGSAPAGFSIPAFTAPCPLRRVVSTPMAEAQTARASKRDPGTVTEAKLWNLHSQFKLSGTGEQLLQGGTDRVFVRVVSPSLTPRIATTRSAEQQLLTATVDFLRWAHQGPDSPVLDVPKIKGAADTLREALRTFTLRQAYDLGQVADIESTTISFDKDKWVWDNKRLGVDVHEGSVITVDLNQLDVCAFPCATTEIHVKRNEWLLGGLGTNPSMQKVNDAFVYATPVVGFKSPAIPSIELPYMLRGGTAAPDAAIWLTSLLKELIPTGVQSERLDEIVFQLRLGFLPNAVYAVSQDDAEPAAVVMVTARGAVASTDLPRFGGAAAAAWLRDVGNSAGVLGFWCAEVTLFRQGATGAPERFMSLQRVHGNAPAGKKQGGVPLRYRRAAAPDGGQASDGDDFGR